jgi:general secretion pathway protein L
MSAITAPPRPAPTSPSLWARLRAWWIAEARETGGSWNRDPLTAPDATLLILRPGEADVDVEARSGGKSTFTDKIPIGSVTPGRLRALLRRARAPSKAPVVIDAPPGVVLSHSITLPATAAAAVPALVQDVVRRKTPLSPERFHIVHALAPQPGGGDKTTLRIALVPREWATGQLARLGLGIDSVSAIMVDMQGEAPMFAPLAPPAPRRGAAVLRTLMMLAASGGLCWLAWAAWQTEAAIRDVDARLAAIAPQARETIARQRASGDARTLVDALSERRAKAGPIVLWRELTMRVPADTFIVDLQIGERDVTLAGYSSAATALIPLLESSPLLKEAAFTGAIVFDQQERRERFSIRAALRHPQPAPEALR